MQRITITVDDELVVALDHVIAVSVYQNRSEAIRDLMRVGIAQFQLQVHGNDRRSGVAALVYVYDHQARELAKRLTRSSHEHHDLSVATMHIHLDHDSCMEVAILKGAMSDVRHFAQRVISERGMRHGELVTVPAKFENQKHAHGAEPGQQHLHIHVREAE
jgi:CopG family nickel-responsive transcriptional regulator